MFQFNLRIVSIESQDLTDCSMWSSSSTLMLSSSSSISDALPVGEVLELLNMDLNWWWWSLSFTLSLNMVLVSQICLSIIPISLSHTLSELLFWWLLFSFKTKLAMENPFDRLILGVAVVVTVMTPIGGEVHAWEGFVMSDNASDWAGEAVLVRVLPALIKLWLIVDGETDGIGW